MAFNLEQGKDYQLLNPLEINGQVYQPGTKVRHQLVNDGSEMAHVIMVGEMAVRPSMVLDVTEMVVDVKK